MTVWLRTSEAAAHMKVAPKTLLNWRAMKPPKGPPFRKVGAVVVYDLAEIDAYVNGETVAA